MKTIILFLLCVNCYAQDTTFTAKSVYYKGRFIAGYVVCSITKNDTTFKRVEKHSQLPKSVSWRKNHGVYLKDYPVNLLKQNEVYQYNLRSNKL